MKKIIIASLAVILITPPITSAVWWNSMTWFKKTPEKNEVIKKTEPINNNQTKKINNTTYCDGVFDKVINKIGADYDKCVEDLDFSSDCKLPDGSNISYDKINVVVILDSSGSMEGLVSGQKKIDIAKKTLINFVSSLPKEINVSLVAYGHKGSNLEIDKAVSCAGVETIYPLSSLDTTSFISKVNSFSSKGWTPIASAIKQAENILKASGTNNKNIIYIVSDGLETCGGDPAKIASEVNKSGSKVEVNIIGFAVNNEEQIKLKETAIGGGGKFYLANNSNDLNKVFNDNKTYINSYLSCNNTATGRLFTESSALFGRASLCFGSTIGRESMDFDVEMRNLSKEDMTCQNVLAEKLVARQKNINKIQNDLNSRNLNSFNSSFLEIKSKIINN